MMLKHICPRCGKEHECDTTPEPSKLCHNCAEEKIDFLKKGVLLPFLRDFIEGWWAHEVLISMKKELRFEGIPDGGYCYRLYVSTGGLSENEDDIEKLRKTDFWFFYWYSSQRGGHFTFDFKVEQYPELEELYKEFEAKQEAAK